MLSGRAASASRRKDFSARRSHRLPRGGKSSLRRMSVGHCPRVCRIRGSVVGTVLPWLPHLKPGERDVAHGNRGLHTHAVKNYVVFDSGSAEGRNEKPSVPKRSEGSQNSFWETQPAL